MKISLPMAKLQVGFAFQLAQMKGIYLLPKLLDVVGDLDIKLLDKELAEICPSDSLATLASQGMRAELLFPTRMILQADPFLLAYYRLLYGFSQKEFYTKETGASCFKGMEISGKIGKGASLGIDDLCTSFAAVASDFLTATRPIPVNREFLSEMTLLTVGPQLRGGANNRRGSEGVVKVFDIVKQITNHTSPKISAAALEVKNAAGRIVHIEFASDPDLVIREEISKGKYRNVVSIEIKAGTDVSNIHNRIGEAEKSHQKARKAGYTECWTIVNVPIDQAQAKVESPSTDRFYVLGTLLDTSSTEFLDFKDRFVAVTSISGN